MSYTSSDSMIFMSY